MTALDAGLAGGLVLGLAGVGAWACYVAVRYDRPRWGEARWLGLAAWWLGHAVLGALLLGVAGLIVGLFATAALRVLRS